MQKQHPARTDDDVKAALAVKLGHEPNQVLWEDLVGDEPRGQQVMGDVEQTQPALAAERVQLHRRGPATFMPDVRIARPMADIAQSIAEIVMRLGGSGRERDGAPEHRFGFVEIAGRRRDGRQDGAGDRVGRRGFKHAAIERRRLGESAAAMRGERPLQKLIGRRRHGSEGRYGSRQLRYSTS